MYWGALPASVVCVSVGVALVTGEPASTSCSVTYTDNGTEVVTCADGSTLLMGSNEVVSEEQQLDFRDRTLEDLDFRLISLTGAQFQGAKLKAVNFRGVNLTGADFSNAVFREVELGSANLTGVNLKGARFDGVQVKGAVWSETTCPTGISSEDNGGTCEGQMRP